MKQLTAKTPNGHTVQIREIKSVGPASQEGSLYYGDLRVAAWCGTGAGTKYLADALLNADKYIAASHLHLVSPDDK